MKLYSQEMIIYKKFKKWDQNIKNKLNNKLFQWWKKVMIKSVISNKNFQESKKR